MVNGNSAKFRFGTEHKEFLKDLTNVIISYTPLSGIADTLKFSHKWFGKKRVGHRVARYVKEQDRRNYIKKRSDKIRAAYSKLDKRYS